MLKYVLVGLALIVLAGALSSCSTSKLFRQHQQFYEQHIEGNHHIHHYHLKSDRGVLHYAVAGDESLPAIVFVHGTPGSWRDMSSFLVEPQLRERFQIFSVDRPGWGESISTPDQTVTAFSHQAQQIALLLEHIHGQNDQRPIIVAGHSLGASIAPYIALQYPQLVSGLLLVSGSYDPQLAKPRRYHRAGEWPIVNSLIGQSLRKANKEMLILDKQLVEIEGRWGEIRVPVTAIQGEKDSLVEPDNTGFLQRVLAHNPSLKILRLKNTGHFTHLKSQEVIVHSAVDMLQQVALQ